MAAIRHQHAASGARIVGPHSCAGSGDGRRNYSRPDVAHGTSAARRAALSPPRESGTRGMQLLDRKRCDGRLSQTARGVDMDDSRLYHEGSRELQDRFDTRRIADRLERVDLHQAFTDAERAMIESAPMFFLATIDPDGFPDVSYKGGMPGFVRVVGDSALAFPNYDGNGMYKSLGNVRANPHVGLVFIGGEPEVHLSVPGTRGEQFGRLAKGQRDLVPTVVCHEYSNARSRAIQRVNSPEVMLAPRGEPWFASAMEAAARWRPSPGHAYGPRSVSRGLRDHRGLPHWETTRLSVHGGEHAGGGLARKSDREWRPERPAR